VSSEAGEAIFTMAKVPSLPRGKRLRDKERSDVAAELLRRYNSGKSIREICSETGYSIGRVRRLLEEAGVSFRRRGGASRGQSVKT
jgi:Helix-turn-helix domain